MDIALYDVHVTSKYDLALMAGVNFYVDPKAEFTTIGNFFVYDKEVNEIGFFYHDGQQLCPITFTAYHYDKYLSNKTTYSYLSTGRPYSAANTNIRTPSNLKDAKITIDGKWIVKSGGSNGSGFYTTVENPLANDTTYGAKITSNGGGLVDFQHLGTTKNYQMQGTNAVNIPVSNARLRNGDNTYSAGESMTEPSKYYYYKEEERWLVPQFGITNPQNNEFTVTLPQQKLQNVICNVTTAGISDVTKDNFTITLPQNTRFSYTLNSHSYSVTDDEGTLTIPLTYNPVNIDNTGSPYTETMTISYTYYDPIEEDDKQGTATVTLVANENYMPDFTVTVGGKDVTIDNQYTFAQTAALNTLPANVVITPVTNTVANSLNTSLAIFNTSIC